MSTVQEKIDKANKFLEEKKVPEAEKQLRQAVELDKTSIPAKLELLRLLGLLKKWEDFDKIVEDAVSLASDNADVLTFKGINFSRQQKYTEAIEYYQKALAINPNLVMAHTNLGTALRETNQLDKSEETFQTGIKLDPSNFHLHYELAQTYAYQMRIDSATFELLETLKLNSKYERAYLSLAKIYQQIKQNDQAIEILKQCLINVPTSEEALNFLRDIFLLKKDFQSAYSLWEQVTAQRGLMSDFLELSKICLAANNVPQAEQILLRAARINPNSWQPHSYLGEFYDLLGVMDKALEKHKLAVRLSKTSYEPYNAFALHLAKKGDLQNAASQFAVANKLAPNESSVVYNYAVILTKVNRMSEAKNLLESSLKASPNQTFHNEMTNLLNLINKQQSTSA
jgi:tetratricopeptide (TPR) repeat protein